MQTDRDGRRNQRLRTRKDLLVAASKLLKLGRRPTLEEVAEAALVSRATAYRYFPRVEILLLEACFDLSTPAPEDLLRRSGTGIYCSIRVRRDRLWRIRC